MALSAQVLPALAARTNAARGGRRASSVGKARAARHAIETRRSPAGWGALARVHTGGPEKKVEAPTTARRLVVVHGTEDDVDAVTKKWSLGAGLWKAFRSKPTEGETGKSCMDTAKKLLKRYGRRVPHHLHLPLTGIHHHMLRPGIRRNGRRVHPRRHRPGSLH
jgi:hypothetical protein